MSFKYSYTFPISGPNKIPRFRKWVLEHASDIPMSLPPQVPIKSTAMTIRLRSPEDRQVLTEKLASVAV